MTVAQIREWHDVMAAGGGVRGSLDDDEYERAVILAIARYLNGHGADESDPHGERAMAVVRGALSADLPAADRR